MTWRELLQTLLFGYPMPPEMIDPRFPELLQKIGGLGLTLVIALLSLTAGILLGCVLALCRRETGENVVPVLHFIRRGLGITATAFVEIIRGLPLMLLALLVFYLPYPITGRRFPGVILAVAAFSLYAGVYFSELIRSGFRTIPPGLREAGRVLGLRPRQIFLKIELPLVIRNMLPDVANLAVTVFRDTSMLSVVAVAELTYTGRQMLMSQPMDYGLVLILTMLLYWVPSTLISFFLTARGNGGYVYRKNHLSFQKS